MVGGAQKDGAGWSGKLDRAETWAEFDALPRGVKRVYWEAPYLYTAIAAVLAWRAGRDLRHEVSSHLASMRADRAREALRLYGPHHPQAGA